MLSEGKNIDLDSYRPTDEDRLKTIHDAFITCATFELGPIRRHLFETYEEEFSYDELTLARLFLSTEDRMAIESI